MSINTHLTFCHTQFIQSCSPTFSWPIQDNTLSEQTSHQSQIFMSRQYFTGLPHQLPLWTWSSNTFLLKARRGYRSLDILWNIFFHYVRYESRNLPFWVVVVKLLGLGSGGFIHLGGSHFQSGSTVRKCDDLRPL